MHDRKCASRQDQPTSGRTREACHGALDLTGIAHVECTYLHAERGCDRLDRAEQADAGSDGGIAKDCRLAPGRARLSTKPPPTGSATTVNTTGTVWVASSSGRRTELPEARMTSGMSATNSAAYLRVSAGLPPVHLMSTRALRPTIQCNSCSPCRNAAMRACPSASFAARAESGHVAAPPNTEMNERRFTARSLPCFRSKGSTPGTAGDCCAAGL